MPSATGIPSNVICRESEPSDAEEAAPVMAKLYANHQNTIEGQVPLIPSEEQLRVYRNLFEDWLANPQPDAYRFWIAKADGKTVGYGTFDNYLSLPQQGAQQKLREVIQTAREDLAPETELKDWWVLTNRILEPAYRAKGIGHELLKLGVEEFGPVCPIIRQGLIRIKHFNFHEIPQIAANTDLRLPGPV
ncbi:MAG: hypothetical protein Q9162_005378 [Coniocarpon cinnabarinum]